MSICVFMCTIFRRMQFLLLNLYLLPLPISKTELSRVTFRSTVEFRDTSEKNVALYRPLCLTLLNITSSLQHYKISLITNRFNCY